MEYCWKRANGSAAAHRSGQRTPAAWPVPAAGPSRGDQKFIERSGRAAGNCGPVPGSRQPPERAPRSLCADNYVHSVGMHFPPTAKGLSSSAEK